MIHIFNVQQGYTPQAQCRGHSSTITHLDWAADSSVLQATDGQTLGEVTSGLLSPSIDAPIALGYVPPKLFRVKRAVN